MNLNIRSDKMPADFGLPPYHFHCRTMIVPVYVKESEKIDKNTGKSYTITNTRQGERLNHIDNLGREIAVKDEIYDKIIGKNSKHKLSEKDLIGALNSIKYIAPKSSEALKTVAMSENGIFMVFDGNFLVTAFKPDKNIKEYFNDDASQGKILNVMSGDLLLRVKKWVENL